MGGSLFEIVAVDAIDSAIEIQHFDGTVEELEPETWFTLDAEQVGAPEDWSGSVDVSIEDLPGRRMPSPDWRQQCDLLDDIELYSSGDD